MADSGVRRVVPLTFGWVDLPETVSVHGGDPSVRLREPVPGVLLEVDGGWLLLDTGYNPALLRDPWLRARFHDRDLDGLVVELLDDLRDPLELAFELVGVDPAEVAAVALSHLHNDHAGGLRWFAGRAPVHVQRRELEYGLHGLHGPPGARPEEGPERNGFIRVDYDDPAIDWRVADGDVEVAPGVLAVATYGHTPGHQSFVVTLDPVAADAYGVPGFVLAFDAADLQRNIDEELAIGGFIGCPAEQTVEAIRRLKAIAAERGFRLVPGHDPEVWPTFTASLGLTAGRQPRWPASGPGR